jgi:hypothetical protein
VAINFAVSEASKVVLAALQRHGAMCIHQLHKETQMPYTQLRRLVQTLMKESRVIKVFDEEGNHDRLYKLAFSVEIFDDGVPDKLPELFGLDEETARSRVMLLQRFRDRLHCELHPVLNTVIADYQKGLKAIERRRGDDIDE